MLLRGARLLERGRSLLCASGMTYRLVLLTTIPFPDFELTGTPLRRSRAYRSMPQHNTMLYASPGTAPPMSLPMPPAGQPPKSGPQRLSAIHGNHTPYPRPNTFSGSASFGNLSPPFAMGQVHQRPLSGQSQTGASQGAASQEGSSREYSRREAHLRSLFSESKTQMKSYHDKVDKLTQDVNASVKTIREERGYIQDVLASYERRGLMAEDRFNERMDRLVTVSLAVHLNLTYALLTLLLIVSARRWETFKRSKSSSVKCRKSCLPSWEVQLRVTHLFRTLDEETSSKKQSQSVIQRPRTLAFKDLRVSICHRCTRRNQPLNMDTQEIPALSLSSCPNHRQRRCLLDLPWHPRGRPVKTVRRRLDLCSSPKNRVVNTFPRGESEDRLLAPRRGPRVDDAQPQAGRRPRVLRRSKGQRLQAPLQQCRVWL